MDKIAEKMGKTQSNVSQIINNPSPTLGKLREIAGIIGCEWWEFFLDEIDPVKYQKARGGCVSSQSYQSALICPVCGGAFVIDVHPVATGVAPQQQDLFADDNKEEQDEQV